jgi:hypothetical protein
VWTKSEAAALGNHGALNGKLSYQTFGASDKPFI